MSRVSRGDCRGNCRNVSGEISSKGAYLLFCFSSTLAYLLALAAQFATLHSGGPDPGLVASYANARMVGGCLVVGFWIAYAMFWSGSDSDK